MLKLTNLVLFVLITQAILPRRPDTFDSSQGFSSDSQTTPRGLHSTLQTPLHAANYDDDTESYEDGVDRSSNLQSNIGQQNTAQFNPVYPVGNAIPVLGVPNHGIAAGVPHPHHCNCCHCRHCGKSASTTTNNNNNNLNVAPLSNDGIATRSDPKEGSENPLNETILADQATQTIENEKGEKHKVEEDAKEEEAKDYIQSHAPLENVREEANNFIVEESLSDVFEPTESKETREELSDLNEETNEAKSAEIQEELHDVELEEEENKTHTPSISKTLSESMNVLEEIPREIQESMAPIVEPDRARRQEVFCDEVKETAAKAKKLQSTIDKQVADLKLAKVTDKLEKDAAEAQNAINREELRRKDVAS